MEKFGNAWSGRVEDSRLLRGDGRYTDDTARPGGLHGVVLRSPHAAARIVSVDVGPALALPGVVAAYTARDLAADGIGAMPCPVVLTNRDGTPQQSPPHPVLADGIVRHVGDPVAFVVARTPQAAADGAEAIGVEYDVTEPVIDLLAAIEDGQQQLVWPDAPRNICFDWEIGDRARCDALFASAAHVIKRRIVNNRVVVASMEPRAAAAEYDAGTERWTLTTNTQGVWLVRDLLAKSVFNVDPGRFRVVTEDVGGGFGMKAFLYAEHALTCYAARKLGQPVKWTSGRSEAFLSDSQGRDNITFGELAVDANGRFLALRSRNIANMGAYLSTYGPYIPTLAGSKVLPSVYRFETVYLNVLGVFTNTVPVDAYRGAGRPESNYLVERLVDAAARELGIDPVELRRRNMVSAAEMPYRTPVGETYDSGEFARVMDAALARIDRAGFAARRAEAAKRGRCRGLGFACYLEATMGSPEERAEIRFAQDGNVDVYVGTQSTGQGHETAYIALMSERLDIPADRIRIRQGDSDAIPMGGGTGGSRSLYSEGQAMLATAKTVVEKGRKEASAMLETSVEDITFADGSFQVVGTDRRVGILELAAARRADDGRSALDAAETVNVDRHTFPNGCHAAEVEVDPETGHVAILRYVVADDFGRILHPMIVRGQVQGGVAQGIGQAIFERTVYDDASGQLLTGSFMDYTMPRAEDFPDFDVEFVEIPTASNALGVKGAGEAGSVGSSPAVMNAVIDALAARGVSDLDMPATPERVWKALLKAA